MNSNIIYLKGVPTPRYTAQKIRQDKDPDLFVDMLANHPEHIRRSVEKLERVKAQMAREAAQKAAEEGEHNFLFQVFGNVAVWSLLALMVVLAL